MRRLLLSMILFLAVTFNARPATKLDYATVDKLSYQYFTDQKWDSVIYIGKKALKDGIDYYYLRVRLGISYFTKQEYFPAVTHFVKAREFNSDDPVITDYLYRAYIYINRNDEALLIKPKKQKGKSEAPVSGYKVLEQLNFEGGYSLTNDKSGLKLPPPEPKFSRSGNQEIYGIQDLYLNSIYGNINLKLRIFKRLSLSLAYNYLNISKTLNSTDGRFEDRFMRRADTVGGHKYLYSFPWVIHDTSFQDKVGQHEALIGLTITLHAGFKVFPVFHFIHASNTTYNATLKVTSIQDTAFLPSNGNPIRTFAFTHYDYTFHQKDTAFDNYLIALMVTKYLGVFNLGLSGSWSDFNGLTQEQAGLTLTYYPLGNLNFYGTSAVSGFFQGNESRLLLSQVLGTKLTSWCWVEGLFYWGNYSNANILNGSVVYNNSDKMDYRAAGTVTFIAGAHLQLYLMYQYFRNESQQIYHVRTLNPLMNQTHDQLTTINSPYNINNLIGGLTWKL